MGGAWNFEWVVIAVSAAEECAGTLHSTSFLVKICMFEWWASFERQIGADLKTTRTSVRELCGLIEKRSCRVLVSVTRALNRHVMEYLTDRT